MASLSFGVSLDGFKFPDSSLTWNLEAAIVATDVGKVVTLDTSAANTVKLAGADDVILGRLETVEIRASETSRTGMVAFQFVDVVPYTGSAPALGAKLTGSATAGTVKTATSPVDSYPTVVEVRSTLTPPVVVALKI